MTLSSAEAITWVAMQQRRPLHEIARILNRVPQILCGRAKLYDENEVHDMVHRLIVAHEAGELVEAHP